MKNYLSAFDSRITGLTGTQEQVARAIKAYRVFAEKVPTGDDDYTMNHTAIVYLFDGQGILASTLSWEEDEKTRLAKLTRLADRG